MGCEGLECGGSVSVVVCFDAHVGLCCMKSAVQQTESVATLVVRQLPLMDE